MPEQLADHTEFDQIMAKDSRDREIILVKQGEDIHAYINSCPHIGIGLDYGNGRVLNDNNHLLCAMHGALFEPDTGYCFAGPCSGQSLERVAITIEDDKVFLNA